LYFVKYHGLSRFCLCFLMAISPEWSMTC